MQLSLEIKFVTALILFFTGIITSILQGLIVASISTSPNTLPAQIFITGLDVALFLLFLYIAYTAYRLFDKQ